MKINKISFLSILIIVFLFSCKSGKEMIVYKEVKTTQKKTRTVIKIKKPIPSIADLIIQDITKSPSFKNHFTGLVLYDQKKQKILLDYNGDKYFTPASNLKLFTFYTCLKVLEDPIPLFKYYENEDTIYIKTTANPSFLHPYLGSSDASFSFLKNTDKEIFFDFGVFLDEPFGDGWAWDDASYYYQCEKTSFPIYGNVLCMRKSKNTTHWIVDPPFFNTSLSPTSKAYSQPIRDAFDNTFYISDSINTLREMKFDIPFKCSNDLLLELLSDTLHKKIQTAKSVIDYDKSFETNLDPLYKRIVTDSDNMITEQLLLHASYTLFDTMSSKMMIDYSLDNYLSDLRQKPKWVDGSGLSRYNLVSPHSVIQVLDKIYRRLPREKINYYFPHIALKNNATVSDSIWIYAKSGSLSNNYNLSGFIECKSGTTILFSFMNNHYQIPKKKLVEEVNKILYHIYLKY